MKTSAPIVLLLAVLTAPAGFAAGSPLTLVSQADPSQVSDTASGGDLQQASLVPSTASISADGRYAVFLSAASNLIPGQRDVNASPISDGQDVFLADLTAGTVTLVSHSIGLPTTSGNRGSSKAVISADGRWVVFSSAAADLAPGQPTGPVAPGDQDVLLYDRVTGTTTFVAATSSSSIYSLGISADGHYITFDGNADLVTGANEGDHDVFLYDRVSRTTGLVSHVPGSPVNGPSGAFSFEPRISADGRFILFFTTDLDPPPGQIPITSAVLYDRVTDGSKPVGPASNADLSADGNYVAFTTDGGLQLYSRETGTATLVSTNALGRENGGGPNLFALNADGRFLVYVLDDGSGLAVYDRTSRSTTPVSRPAGAPQFDFSIGTPMFSADGRYVVFDSADPAWVAGQVDTNTVIGGGSDVFLLDRGAGKIALVSHTSTSRTTTGNGSSFAPSISANGARLLYFSEATDLEQGLHDLNGRPDLFAYDTAPASNQAVTRRAPALPSTSAPINNRATAMSVDGRFVVCETISYGAFTLNNQTDIFLYDRLAKTRLLVDHIRGSAVTPARGLSKEPVLSADGRYVAFLSDARNLVPGTNPNGAPSLYLFDRISGTVTFVARVYNYEDGLSHPKPRLSADGRWLAFVSNAPDVVPGQQGSEVGNSVFLYDRITATTLLVSHTVAGLTVAGDGESAVLSADGRYLAFLSGSPDLIPGEIPTDPLTSGYLAAFLYDRVTGATTLISHLRDSPLAAAAVYGGDPAMSADGRYITLLIDAEDLDPSSPSSDGPALYIYDRVAGTYQQVSSSASFSYDQAAEISADGRVVAFPSDHGVFPNTQLGLLLYDRVTRSLSLAAADIYIGAGNDTFALSGDSRYVAFASDTPGPVPGLTRAAIWGGTDVYLLDRTTGSTILINQFLGSSVTTAGFADTPLLSANGQTVVFTSSVDLVPGDYNNLLDAYAFTLGGSTPGGPVAVPPCVLFNGALRSNVRKPLIVAGACGVPAAAKQVAIKLTVSQGTGQGNVQLFAGSATTSAAGILRFGRGASRGAPFNVVLGNGVFSLVPFVAGKGTVRVSVEIDGYTP